MPESQTISKLTARLAETLSMLIALAFPAGYFFVSYQFIAGSLDAEVEINARLVSGVISANPLLWRFEQDRLEELLARRPRSGYAETRRIFDDKGVLVAESPTELKSPVLKRSYELRDAGTMVGKIEISRSLRPLLERTCLAGLFGFGIGLLAFLLLPYREVGKKQKRLQDANAFLNTVMESSTNAIVVLDLAGRIRLANRRCSELSGYSQAELGGAPFRTLFAGSSWDRVQQAVANISTGRSHSVCLETELCRRDGRSTEISFGAAPFSQAGESAGFVVSIEDITNRKLWEKRLKSFTAELEESNAELKSFAYIISHDLRAPLVNIKGFAAELNGSLHELAVICGALSPLLEEADRAHLATLFDQDIPEALDFINGSVVRMDGLINAILKLSRIGHRELKAEPVPLREMVDAILKSMFHQIEERHSKVSIGDFGELRSDRMALEQILGNLLDNAVKYLDPGRPGELEISGTSDATGATIHIRDNGRGIAQEDISRIFEVFRRAGRQDVQGEGMGLAYVKALVRKLHGQIWCRSELGVGSTFSFTIPHGGSPNGNVGAFEQAGGGKLSDPLEGEHDELSRSDTDPVGRG